MSFETSISLENQEQQKQKIEKHETNQEKQERLVVFEIKNKIAPNIVKNKLNELKQLEQELEHMKKYEIEDDFSVKIKKIEEIKNWIEENVIIHYVEK